MTTNIYVLKLEKDFYYVGKTTDIAKRYQQHLDGKGSAWTKIHKPVSILEIKPSTSAMDEDKYTKEYMIKYGIDKVRGGSYVKEELDDAHMKLLQKELWSSQDLCTRCGRKGHFIKNCSYKKDVNGNVINDIDELLPSNINMTVLKTAIAAAVSIVTETMTEASPKNKNVKVEEKVETFNCKYCNREFESKKGKTFHENLKCKNKPEKNIEKGCDICGHTNHDSSNCYASKDVNGNKIEEVLVWECDYCDKEFSDEEKCEKHETKCEKTSKKLPICFVCKKPGHYANQCYAR
jgi:predicted GIY-YIG superfamily endonuclease